MPRHLPPPVQRLCLPAAPSFRVATAPAPALTKKRLLSQLMHDETMRCATAATGTGQTLAHIPDKYFLPTPSGCSRTARKEASNPRRRPLSHTISCLGRFVFVARPFGLQLQDKSLHHNVF